MVEYHKKNSRNSIKSHANRKINQIFLVRGEDEGKPAWYYVQVSHLKLPLLQADIEKNKNGVVDLQGYGIVVRYGWGENPPESIQQEIKDKYG